jgi:hypothetical protein
MVIEKIPFISPMVVIAVVFLRRLVEFYGGMRR